MGESTQPSPAVADYSQWQAQDYFKTYYSEVVLPDEQAVLAYQVQMLKRTEHKFGRGLEYGCGPTLHRAIANGWERRFERARESQRRPTRLSHPAVLAELAGRGTFSVTGTLKSGSGDYYRVTQAPGQVGFTVRLTSSSGTPISTSVLARLNVIRVK